MEGTEYGKKRLQDMDLVTMKEVRERVQHLLRQGYDVTVPKTATEDENMKVFDASLHIVRTMYQENRLEEQIQKIRETNGQLQDLLVYIGDALVPYLAAVPLKRVQGKQGANLQAEFANLLVALAASEADHTNDGDDMYCAIDSEEEDRLFEELDYLVDAQERAEAFRGNAYKFMANSFQRVFLKVTDLEIAYRMVSFTRALDVADRMR